MTMLYSMLPSPTLLKSGIIDITKAMDLWRIWLGLAWKDIRMRYMRSLIGPFWLAIGMAIWAVGIGIVWSTLFNIELEGYMPYLTAGIIAWQLFSQAVNEAPHVFISTKQILDSLNLPLSVQAFRFTTRHFIIYFHSLPTFIFVALIFGVDINKYTLLYIPGLFLFILNIGWIAIFVGTLGARFRDLQPIIANLSLLLFFITPIFWERSFLGNKTFIADFNPVFHLINLVRAPLLGEVPPLGSYWVVLAITTIGWTLTIVFFSRFRVRIHYWI